MTTHLHILEGEKRESLHRFAKGAYLDGLCYEMAIALHRTSGWKMVALNYGHPERHAAVRDPGGQLFDVRGRAASEEEFGKPFGAAPPLDLREVTEEELRLVRPISEVQIRRAMFFVELLWPELAQNEKSTRLFRHVQFVNELEALSRRHGIWIRSPVPAVPTWPVLAEADGSETGYELQPSEDGNAYFVNRSFKE